MFQLLQNFNLLDVEYRKLLTVRGEPWILMNSSWSELHAVILLPEFETDDDVKLEDITAEEWKTVAARFANLPVDGYWLVFDPIEAQENETVYATLADDLADIYRDTKYGLRLFDAGHIAEAIWEWKFHFKIHWGWHLLGAQRVIHFWFVHNGDDDL